MGANVDIVGMKKMLLYSTCGRAFRELEFGCFFRANQTYGETVFKAVIQCILARHIDPKYALYFDQNLFQNSRHGKVGIFEVYT